MLLPSVKDQDGVRERWRELKQTRNRVGTDQHHSNLLQSLSLSSLSTETTTTEIENYNTMSLMFQAFLSDEV